jgi:STAS domain
MGDADAHARAVIVFVVDDREFPCGAVGHGTRCDLGLIDALARLQLAAQRLGWSIRLRHVERDLRDLVELVGLSDRLGL